MLKTRADVRNSILHSSSTAQRGNSSKTATSAIIFSMTATAAQFTANRANATKSTGPKSPEGRAVSALNSQRHGLRSEAVSLLPSESRTEWEELFTDLRNEWSPETPTECLLVEKMAAAEWKRRRSEVFEAGGLQYEGANAQDGAGMAFVRDCNKGQTLSLVIRYRRAADSAFMAAKHELERQQARRNLPEGATMPAPLAIDVTVVGAAEPADE